MINIITERLNIFPLTEKELENCMENFEYIENALCLNSSKIEISDRRKRVHKIRLEKVKQDTKNYTWNTIWLIIFSEENRIVGSIMIKGYPDENGEVIIGYSIEEGYKCKGYMTEALNGLVNWIFDNLDVKYILADTLKDNNPSHRVLQKIGMVKYKEDDECFWWRLER